MFCLACDKKLKDIKEDKFFNNWTRKYHKKCWNERLIYLQMRENIKRKNEDVPEWIEKLCCMK